MYTTSTTQSCQQQVFGRDLFNCEKVGSGIQGEAVSVGDGRLGQGEFHQGGHQGR